MTMMVDITLSHWPAICVPPLLCPVSSWNFEALVWRIPPTEKKCHTAVKMKIGVGVFCALHHHKSFFFLAIFFDSYDNEFNQKDRLHRFILIHKLDSSICCPTYRPFYSCKLSCQAFNLEWFTFEKQQGLYYNKVTLGLTPIQRLCNQPNNCKMN